MTATQTQVLVGVGASLGGLSACRRVLAGLSADLPAAVLIAQHRRPDGLSTLADLLASECALPVVEPDDKTPIAPGAVYLGPADYHIAVERDGGHIALSTEPKVNYARPSIDLLFDSIAVSVRARGMAVVLTGASHDGARGALAVKRAGGRVLVQDPDEAESAVCPRAALALLQPDAVLRLDQIALAVTEWARLLGRTKSP